MVERVEPVERVELVEGGLGYSNDPCVSGESPSSCVTKSHASRAKFSQLLRQDVGPQTEATDVRSADSRVVCKAWLVAFTSG